jgi:hypothetical protein
VFLKTICGEFWLREFAPEGSESVGFSHSDFGFVVQALDYAAGELFVSAEIVEDEFTVGA